MKLSARYNEHRMRRSAPYPSTWSVTPTPGLLPLHLVCNPYTWSVTPTPGLLPLHLVCNPLHLVWTGLDPQPRTRYRAPAQICGSWGWGLGFEGWGLGVRGSGFGVRGWGLLFGVCCLGFRIWGLGAGGWGLGLGAWGLGLGGAYTLHLVWTGLDPHP